MPVPAQPAPAASRITPDRVFRWVAAGLALFVVLVGAQLGGILGMLLAIPVVTTVRVVVQEIIWSYRNFRSLRLA
jgi:hypothetical protein